MRVTMWVTGHDDTTGRLGGHDIDDNGSGEAGGEDSVERTDWAEVMTFRVAGLIVWREAIHGEGSDQRCC